MDLDTVLAEAISHSNTISTIIKSSNIRRCRHSDTVFNGSFVRIGFSLVALWPTKSPNLVVRIVLSSVPSTRPALYEI